MENRYKLILLIIILTLPFFISTKAFASSITLQSDMAEIGNQEDEYTVNITLSINVPDNTENYLRGAFYKPNTNDYCGYTWNDKDWFNGPYTTNDGWKNLLKISIKNLSWSGTLKAKIDPNEKACSDSGKYNFKIIRYTTAGSQGNENQEPLAVNFIAPPTPTQTPTNTPVPTSTPKPPTPTKIPPASTRASTPTNAPTSSLKNIPVPTLKSSLKLPSKSSVNKTSISPTKISSRSATPKAILGISTKSATLTPMQKKADKSSSFSPLVFSIVGAILFVICAILVALKIKWKQQ